MVATSFAAYSLSASRGLISALDYLRRWRARGSRQTGFGVVEHQVGAGGDGDRLTAIAAASLCRPWAARISAVPRARRSPSLGCGRRGVHFRWRDGRLRRPDLERVRPCEQGGGLTGVGADAKGVQPFQAVRKCGSAATGSPSIDSMIPANSSVSISPCRRPRSATTWRASASIVRALSGRPRSSSSTARQRSDVASSEGAAVVIRCIRTTSRHRPPALGTGLGPHSAAPGAAPSAAVICRWSPPWRAAMSASKRSTSQSPIRPSRARAPARTRCALASPAGSLRRPNSSMAPCSRASTSQRSGGVDDELTPIAGRPRRQGLVGDAVEFIHQRRTRGDVTRGQERLAADEQKFGVERLVGCGQGRAASRLVAGGDQFVTVEGAAGRREVAARGPESEFTGVLVQRAKLDAVAVGGFQMPGDHLVGVERHARATRVTQSASRSWRSARSDFKSRR